MNSTCDQLALYNLAFARYKTAQYRWTGIEYDDLVSIAYMATVMAARHFDPTKGIKFATYAGVFIRNEILKEVRNMKRCVKAVSLNAVISGGDRDPIELLEVVRSPEPPPGHGLEMACTLKALHEALEALDDRARSVVSLLYGLNDDKRRTQQEIARLVGVSQTHISRIRRKALDQIRERLAIAM